MIVRVVLVLSLTCVMNSVAVGQDEIKNDPKPEKIVLVEPPKTIDEALERQKAAETAARTKLAEAEAAYAVEVENANKQMVAELEQLAKQSAAVGDITAAAKAWEAVLNVDKSNTNAIDFFKTIGRKDILDKNTPTPPRTIKRKEFVDTEGRVLRQTARGAWWDSSDFETGAQTLRQTDSYMVIRNPESGTLMLLLEDQYFWADRTDQEKRVWRVGNQGKWVR